jgi:serine/threonine-protein kinase RsbW
MSTAEKTMRIAITNEPARVSEARRFVRGFLMDIEASEEDVFEILVAVEEAASNAVRHARPPNGKGTIEIRCFYAPSEFVVKVADHGPGFEYEPDVVEDVPDPMASGGRGLFLMNRLMDRVVVEPSEQGTVVTMSRQLNGRDDVPADETYHRTHEEHPRLSGPEISD